MASWAICRLRLSMTSAPSNPRPLPTKARDPEFLPFRGLGSSTDLKSERPVVSPLLWSGPDAGERMGNPADPLLDRGVTRTQRDGSSVGATPVR